MIRSVLICGLMLGAGAAQADIKSADVKMAEYICDRDVRLSVVYINSDGPEAFAVMQIEGRLVALETVRSGSGALYAEIGKNDTGYNWFTKGDEALLGHGNTEGTTILPGCHTAG